MKKIIFSLIIILFIVIISYAFITIYDNLGRVEVELVDCIDGDTARFNVNGKIEKVRFLGIDTPESTSYIEKYGVEASNYTCDVLNSANNIYIEYDINSDKYDKYDRLLGWIFVDNNNLSELLLSKGYAEVMYIYGNYKYMDSLCEAQAKAYRNKLGIWNTNNSNYNNNYCYKNKY